MRAGDVDDLVSILLRDQEWMESGYSVEKEEVDKKVLGTKFGNNC